MHQENGVNALAKVIDNAVRELVDLRKLGKF